jgi:hypothetical protein
MPVSKLRQRITPSVPFLLRVKDANGDVFENSFQIAYDWNALCLLESKLHINALTQFGLLLTEPNATTIAVLLWAGVQKNHPDYAGDDGLEALGSNLNLETGKLAFAACAEALVAQLPEEQQARIKAAKDAKATTPAVDPLATAPAV